MIFMFSYFLFCFVALRWVRRPNHMENHTVHELKIHVDDDDEEEDG